MFAVRLVFLLVLVETKVFFDFGVVNYRPSWIFHCPSNQEKRVEPPINDQPLFSYECPMRTTTFEILPVEIDLTYLCRIETRFFWFIVDFYQFNVLSWRIDEEQIEIRIKFNDLILLEDHRRETANLTSRSIFINAFYVPFESLTSILNDSIEIQIVLINSNRRNRCEFISTDHRTWNTILNDQCQTSESQSLLVHHAECHFYSNHSEKSLSSLPPDLNVILSINDENNSTRVTNFSQQKSFYAFLEENSHLIFSSLNRTKLITNLLKISVGLLVAILVTMILFFIYILFYQNFLRHRQSSIIDRISLDI